MKTVSIVIPTKNAVTYLEETLDTIFRQEANFEFEILAIDSGSTDKTLQILSSYPLRLISIPPHTFNHGDTRNLGVREANPESEFIAFLSQDAKPYDSLWLQYLIQPFRENSEIAGVYGRHEPRPDASAPVARQIIQGATGNRGRLVKKMPESLGEYESNQMSYVFFSNTNSAIRRSVWQKIPFDRVDFAEDAVWADKVLRSGYCIVYEPTAIVVHSHNYSPVEHFRQNVDHAYAMNKHFQPLAYRRMLVWLRLFIGIPIQVFKDCTFALFAPFFSNKSICYKIKIMLPSLPWQTASVFGAWVGAHIERMPPRLKLLLSRQERLRRM